jgi:hypothetical protein
MICVFVLNGVGRAGMGGYDGSVRPTGIGKPGGQAGLEENAHGQVRP